MNHHETKIDVTVQIAINTIRGLLCSAFEGGSNYWYVIHDYAFPDGLTEADFAQGGKMQDPKGYWHPAQLIPTVEGGGVIISPDDEEDRKVTLNLEAIRRGAQVMAQKFPQHWADAVDESGDAITGDVFLQCCLFGEIVYS